MTASLLWPLPTGPYSVIYADPPWAWSKKPLQDRGRARAVEKEYPTMQPDEIADLPVGGLAAKDSVCFLWVTSPKLQIGLDVLAAWGFTYKTVGFCWVKQNRKSDGLFLGMGFYTRSNVELCLVGARGSLKRQDAGVRQVVMSRVQEHSRKPDEVRESIDRLYGDVPRIELFARRRAEGWDAWGNQAPSAEPELVDLDLFGGAA